MTPPRLMDHVLYEPHARHKVRMFENCAPFSKSDIVGAARFLELQNRLQRIPTSTCNVPNGSISHETCMRAYLAQIRPHTVTRVGTRKPLTIRTHRFTEKRWQSIATALQTFTYGFKGEGHATNQARLESPGTPESGRREYRARFHLARY